MDRLKRVAAVWQYLPTFRAVAELEHITKAAEALGVSPSAVSRTIALVEAGVGHELFVREGRRIVLNESGFAFLGAARAAMRIIDDGLLTVHRQLFVGAVRVAAVEPFTSVLAMQTFARLRASHPGLVPSLTRATEMDVSRHVRTGAIDVAFVRHARREPQLSITRIASFATAAYRATRVATRSGARDSPLRTIEVNGPTGAPSAWPAETQREPALIVADYDLALRACLESELATVLPIAIASEALGAGLLERITGIETLAIGIHAVTRESISPGRTEALVEAAREAARESERVSHHE